MGVFYKGIELDGLDKKVGFYHSNAMRAMGQDSNQNADYLEKICEYKRADLAPEQFDEINILWSVVKMNYQICNGGIYQYFDNGFHEGWKCADGETEIWGKDEQVAMMRKLYGFACEVMPDKLAENSKFYRIIEFFNSLYVDYEDEVRLRNSAFALCDFDEDYYQINEYLEKVIELYAQFIEKGIQKDKGLGVDDVVLDAKARCSFGGYSLDELEQMVVSETYTERIKAAKCGYGLDRLVNDPEALVRITVAKQGYGLIDLLGDENEYVRKTAVNKLDEMNGQKPRYPEASLDF